MDEFSVYMLAKQLFKIEELIADFLRESSPPIYRQNDPEIHEKYKNMHEIRIHIIKQLAIVCGYEIVKYDPFKAPPSCDTLSEEKE